MKGRGWFALALLIALAVSVAPGAAFAATGADQGDAGVATVAPAEGSGAALTAASIQPQAAGITLVADSSISYELVKSDETGTVYAFTPAEGGEYSIYSAGSDGAYAYVTDDDDKDVTIKRLDGRSLHGEDFFLACNINAGETYQLTIYGSEGTSFQVGIFPKGKGQPLITCSEATLTDDSEPLVLRMIWEGKSYFGWEGWDYDIIETTTGTLRHTRDYREYHYVEEIKVVKPVKSGKVVMKCTGGESDAVYGTCTIDCIDITEYYALFVGGVHANNKNASNIKGGGISGKVSYDVDTNTLTLKNAVLKASCFTYGDKGYPVSVIGYGGGKTLHIKLVGKNKIENVSYPGTNPDDEYGYEFSRYYTGIEGISAVGAVSLEGSGSLSIDDESIGTAVACKSLSIAEDSTLNVAITFANNSNGVVVDNSVMVNGTLKATSKTRNVVTDEGTGGITGYCMKARKLEVGSTGTVDVSASTTNETTSYGVYLYSGGSATVKGVLKAAAYGASGKKAGVAIGAEEDGVILKAESGGLVTASGNNTALGKVKLKLGKNMRAIAGNSSADAVIVSAGKVGESPYFSAFAPKANTIKAKAKAVSFDVRKLKKKAQSVKASRAFTVKAAKGKVTYKVQAYATKAAKGKVKVAGNGKLTVAKGTSKGSYKIKVMITAKGNRDYKAGSKTVTLKVTVK